MNHGKYGNHTMIMPWIMATMPRNMATMLIFQTGIEKISLVCDNRVPAV